MIWKVVGKSEFRSNGQKGWSFRVGSALMDKRDGELSTGVLQASSFDQALLAG
jgi:hypothetical protein